MVGKDEKRALKLLAEHDDIIEPIIEKHKGTISNPNSLKYFKNITEFKR